MDRFDQYLKAAERKNTLLSYDSAAALRLTRDRSLILLGFWRGFRSDELVRLNAGHIQILDSEGFSIFLEHSKGDRKSLGKSYKCPVTALGQWVTLAQLDHGPVYRGIDRWGQLSNKAMHPNSLIPLLRNMLSMAGVTGAYATFVPR